MTRAFYTIQIKREISKAVCGVKIEKAFATQKGKVVVQVDNEMGASQIVKTLNDKKSFGSNSIVHRPLGNRFGFVRDVHKDISESEIDACLQKEYPGAKSIRLKKEGAMLNSIKIIFQSCAQLKQSMVNGIFVHPQHFQVQEFKTASNSEPIRCFKCQKFHNTVAAFCENIQKCCFCSESHRSDVCPDKENSDKYICCNCGKNHCSNNKSCEKYMEAKDRILINRHNYG